MWCRWDEIVPVQMHGQESTAAEARAAHVQVFQSVLEPKSMLLADCSVPLHELRVIEMMDTHTAHLCRLCACGMVQHPSITWFIICCALLSRSGRVCCGDRLARWECYRDGNTACRG